MAVTKPAKVPEKKISSSDIVSFGGGLDERLGHKGDKDTFGKGRNAMVTSTGLIGPRFAAKRWLPDTVGTIHDVSPVLVDNQLYYFVADDGVVKYIRPGETSWTTCGGDNAVTTGDGIINTFVRSSNKLYVLNGVDHLRFIDVDTLEMVQYNQVDDPTAAPTTSFTGSGVSGSGGARVYYAITFNGEIGSTKLSPIKVQDISKNRVTWKTDGTDYIDVQRNNTVPADAKSWNLFVATDATGSTIAPGDMMPLMKNIDINVTSFRDTGDIAIDLAIGVAPEDNTTIGPKTRYAELADDQLILYGDAANPYAIYIKNRFNPGFYEHSINVGTNYFPMSVVGFRNGQGLPSLTVLSSNTEGLSKQAIIEQQTVTYGDVNFVVWTNTDQNYGAAGVSSPYAVVNYNGALSFPTTDGFVTMDTEASLQNVLSTRRISDPIENTVASVRNANLDLIVGTAWSNRIYWLLPSRGYSFNNEIAILDVNNSKNPIWYKFELRAQWIGTISPSDSAAFVYFCQDNHIFRLEKSYVATDETSDGLVSEFPVEAEGSLIGTTEAHNTYVSVVQAVFYLVGFIGQIEIGVTYRNENGRMKTKSKRIDGGKYASSNAGGWDDPGYLYSGTADIESTYSSWDDFPTVNLDADTAIKKDIRIRMPLNVVTNEMKWFVNTDINQPSAFFLRSVSYEGVSIGVKGDLR